MKDLKKSHDIAGQSNVVQKSRKHDVNLQKNSSLYFQVGLILSLLATYAIFEMKFEDKIHDQATLVPLDPEDTTYQMQDFIVEPDAPKQKTVKKQKPVLVVSDPVIVDNDTQLDETPEIITKLDSKSSTIVDPNALGKNDDPDDGIDEVEIFSMIDVEIVPVYPGCESMTTNEDRVKCMSQKLAKLIQRRFDTDIASVYGLQGRQRINVQFKINQSGQVTEIQTRAPHPKLEKEAERIANKIPQMKPGLQRQKPVSVIYNLPIVFDVKQ